MFLHLGILIVPMFVDIVDKDFVLCRTNMRELRRTSGRQTRSDPEQNPLIRTLELSQGKFTKFEPKRLKPKLKISLISSKTPKLDRV